MEKKRIVNFDDTNAYKNDLNHLYTIKIESRITTSLIIEFPNHPKPDYRRLDTKKKYWSVAALNKDINNRLKASNPTHMLIIDGVRFENIVGNVYLVWASTVNKQNVNGIDVELFNHTPVMIVTDGFGGYRHLYLFCDKKVKHIVKCLCPDKKNPLKRCKEHNFRLDIPIMDIEIFCMESVKRTTFLNKINMIHAQTSKNDVENEIHALHLTNVCSSSEDESEIGSDNDNNV